MGGQDSNPHTPSVNPSHTEEALVLRGGHLSRTSESLVESSSVSLGSEGGDCAAQHGRTSRWGRVYSVLGGEGAMAGQPGPTTHRWEGPEPISTLAAISHVGEQGNWEIQP